MANDAPANPTGGGTTNKAGTRRERHYRELLRHTLLRFGLLYYLPLLLLAAFFHIQTWRLLQTGQNRHLSALAEQQAATLDLFLSERLINLSNVINSPEYPSEPDEAFLKARLSRLQKTSNTFVDLGVLDANGHLKAYVGPFPFLEERNYAGEDWFVHLMESSASFVITDIYLGFRNQPHFTIAVKREIGGQQHVLRSSLSPERLFAFIGMLDHEQSVHMALINETGEYQVVNPDLGDPLEASPFELPEEPRFGIQRTHIDGERTAYGYAWLGTSPWAVVIVPANGSGIFSGIYLTSIVLTLIFFIIGGVVIWVHAARTASRQLEVEEHEEELSGQLVHAAKLASVGELAAGIAHEINNPLAIIAEEVGLLKDLMNPDFIDELDEDEIPEHLDTIYAAVFRCRDITRKLLGFVRQTEVKLEEVDVSEVMDIVVDDLLKSELTASNITLIKKYCEQPRPIVSDKNQLEQVLLNLVKNAVDAMDGKGTLTLKTGCRHPDRVILRVEDTGSGMTQEQLNKIFTPFYTTKAPGKGTGLGLSVSYGIIKSLGGQMYVESEKGVGSTFTVELPLKAE